MKKTTLRILSFILSVIMIAAVFTACDQTPSDNNSTTPTEAHIDYVDQLKLNLSSGRKTYEVHWGERSHIDGDTTHFEVPRDVDPNGIIKARYLAVNTPESTGQIQEWGKAASNFTKEKLSTAVSIILESESEKWNYDGNGRYLVWVWYKPSADADYRCLNIELLQNGLGGSSSSSSTIYGSIAVAAIAQASREKLYMFSGAKDPEFPYGEATSVTLKELRINAAQYEGKKVAVEGMITYNSDYEAYIETYDAETDMYYGMQIFYGYISQLIPVLEPGTIVRVVGVVNNFYGTYQISDLKYNAMRPQDPANTSKISSGNTVAYKEVDPAVFNGNVTILLNDEEKTFKYADLVVSTSISMKNLKVESVYTTTNPDASDTGAMTLTCTYNGATIAVRTAVLKDANGKLITADYFQGKTIDVRGIVDCYEGSYQIRLFSLNDVEIH
jgi:micrococcal nuclease